jgi:hypothetical protein
MLTTDGLTAEYMDSSVVSSPPTDAGIELEGLLEVGFVESDKVVD